MRLSSRVSQAVITDDGSNPFDVKHHKPLEPLKFPDSWSIEKLVSLGNFEMLCKFNDDPCIKSKLKEHRPELSSKNFSFVLDADLNVQIEDPGNVLTEEDRQWLTEQLTSHDGMFHEVQTTANKVAGAIRLAIQNSKSTFENNVKEFCLTNDRHINKNSVESLHREWVSEVLTMATQGFAGGVDIRA